MDDQDGATGHELSDPDTETTVLAIGSGQTGLASLTVTDVRSIFS